MTSARSIIDISDAVQSAMRSIDMVGCYDVRWEGSRSTGWVGKPCGDDYEVVVTVRKLPRQDD